MYILQNKTQLHNFVKSIHGQMEKSLLFAPKISKLKELVAHCLGFNTYAGAISKLPLVTEDFDYTFPKAFSNILRSPPYGIPRVGINNIDAIYQQALEDSAFYDEEAAINAIHMATNPM